MQTKYTPKYIKRFWGKVIKTDNPDDCWLWSGGCNGQGYGSFYMGDKNYSTHRLAYELSFGTIFDSFDVLHSCDNPPCCNPNHLFLGTQQSNMDDMIGKGRAYHPSRENHGMHKLTDAKVLEIRQRYNFRGKNGDNSITLAKEFGVSHSMISYIVNHKNWS